MNNSETTVFTVRTYGRMELAQLYFPSITPQAAWRKLHAWIELNPELRRHLGTDRHLRRTRTFSAREVSLIAEMLGEP